MTQAGVVDAAGVATFVPITILAALLLFLNEFPDADVDRPGGRRHVVPLIGRKRSSHVYVAGLAATYLSILLAVSLKAAPVETIVSLVTVPIAYKAGRIALKTFDRTPNWCPPLG